MASDELRLSSGMNGSGTDLKGATVREERVMEVNLTLLE